MLLVLLTFKVTMSITWPRNVGKQGLTKLSLFSDLLISCFNLRVRHNLDVRHVFKEWIHNKTENVVTYRSDINVHYSCKENQKFVSEIMVM